MSQKVPVIKLNDPAHPERDNGDWIKALDDGTELALSGLPTLVSRPSGEVGSRPEDEQTQAAPG